ncbi:AAA family ATPase [Streptomyces sp. NPDC001020]
MVHAVVGGTPAYRRYVGNHSPIRPDDFDAWVCRTVLSPRTPLFLEAHHLLQEEADHWDRALCHSVLAAIASGCSTQGEIAERLGASLTDASSCLVLLQDNGLLEGEPDAFRPNLIRLRIAEPLLAFEHAAICPCRTMLEQQDAAEIWRRARPAFDSAVAGPHFAQICRDWVMDFADPALFGAHPAAAAYGSLPDPARGAGADAEAEVVVRGRADAHSGPLLSVGVAHWNEVMDLHHLERLRHLLALLATRGEDVTHTLPACYSGVGFTPELRAAEADGQVVLVGPTGCTREGSPGCSAMSRCWTVVRFDQGRHRPRRTAAAPRPPTRRSSGGRCRLSVRRLDAVGRGDVALRQAAAHHLGR